jgi:predicted restriction endonuclease
VKFRFQHWLLELGKSQRTAKSYTGAISGRITSWAKEAKLIDKDLFTIHSYAELHSLCDALFYYPPFIEQNTRGNGMYSAALNCYKDYLADSSQQVVSEDIDEIIKNPEISSTDKSMLVKTRVGQGRFRESLIEYWGQCALTGYAATNFLVASHIKPWRAANDVERLDAFNGILLLPNLDKAFDLGYISFNENGAVKLSEFIETPEKLGISVNMGIQLTAQHQNYMAYHREHIFRC